MQLLTFTGGPILLCWCWWVLLLFFSYKFHTESLQFGEGWGRCFRWAVGYSGWNMFRSLPTLHILLSDNDWGSWWREGSSYLSHFHVLHCVTTEFCKILLTLHDICPMMYSSKTCNIWVIWSYFSSDISILSEARSSHLKQEYSSLQRDLSEG